MLLIFSPGRDAKSCVSLSPSLVREFHAQGEDKIYFLEVFSGCYIVNMPKNMPVPEEE